MEQNNAQKNMVDYFKDPNQVIMMEGSFETMAIFQTQFDMKDCNTFEMLNDDFKDKLYEMYFDHAKKMEGYKNIVLAYHTPTWRVNTDWLTKFGYK